MTLPQLTGEIVNEFEAVVVGVVQVLEDQQRRGVIGAAAAQALL